MRLLRALIAAAALALPLSTFHVVATDVAAQEKAEKKPAKKAAKAKPAKKVVKAKPVKKAKKVAAKCGEYKYHKGGKCMDARDKKS